MIYTTTSCKKCGYRIRNRESNVPEVQLGVPLVICPNCGAIILDSIATEYEFMTDKEKENFSSQSALIKSLPGTLLLLLMGFFLIICGIAAGSDYHFLFFVGLACIGLVTYQFIHNIQTAQNEEIEQAIYESLQRTQNDDYVDFLSYYYIMTSLDRFFQPLENKEAFLQKYKHFEERKSYQENMKNFGSLLKIIDTIIEVESIAKKDFYINPL